MNTLAISKYYIPGEAQFPLNAVYAKPANAAEEGVRCLPYTVS
jgi:actin related protein 2/3 complex subunit 3